MQKNDCVFCHPDLNAKQKVIASNDHCMFLQLEQSEIKGSQLEGAGLIVPKKHRETAFDLSREEWDATYSLLIEVKKYLDEKHQPQRAITSDGIVEKLADNIFFILIYM